jgi:hypothetical protein
MATATATAMGGVASSSCGLAHMGGVLHHCLIRVYIHGVCIGDRVMAIKEYEG